MKFFLSAVCFFVGSVCVFASQAIADMVTEENLAEGRLYPPLSTIREVSFKIAVKVGQKLLCFDETICSCCQISSF